MNKENEEYIDHEVRIRLQEQLNDERYLHIQSVIQDIKDTLRHIDNKMDNQFKWTIGTIVALFGGIILHMAKLI